VLNNTRMEELLSAIKATHKSPRLKFISKNLSLPKRTASARKCMLCKNRKVKATHHHRHLDTVDSLQMSPQVPLGPLRFRRRVRIHAQTPTPATSLASIPLTSGSAATIIEFGDRAKRVPAEALTAVFSARHAVAGLRAVGYTLGVRDGAEVCECDAGEDSVALCLSVLETAAVGPAGCDGRAGGGWAAA